MIDNAASAVAPYSADSTSNATVEAQTLGSFSWRFPSLVAIIVGAHLLAQDMWPGDSIYFRTSLSHLGVSSQKN